MDSSQCPHIAFFGECMVELSGTPLKKGFGGDTLNTALYLARLTQKCGVKVSYATALGEDELSQELLDAWQQEGINTTLVARIAGKLPGLYMVQTDEQGERHFHYWRDSAAVKHYFGGNELNQLEQAIAEHDIQWLYISGISLAILNDASRARLLRAMSQFVANDGKVIFDNNFRPQLWSSEQAREWYGKVLPLVDIALITEEDDWKVWGEQERVETRCLRFGCQEVVIKRGDKPCEVIEARNEGVKRAQVPAVLVEHVVDTCAAGDSFAAGYLAGRLAGHDGEEAAKLGHQLASIVIQYAGAIIPNSVMAHIKPQTDR